jgi:peptide/nickel transport system permease protein
MDYVLRRLVATLPVVAVVAVVVFLLIHLSPGDPAALMAGDLASADDIAQLRAVLGLDLPLWQQFAIWVQHVLSGASASRFSRRFQSPSCLRNEGPTLSIALFTTALSVLFSIRWARSPPIAPAASLTAR